MTQDIEQLKRAAAWALANEGKARKVLAKKKAEESLYEFVKLMWPVLEPGTTFLEGWVMAEVCRHLEAVTAGKVNRLLINVPPGFCKSLITDVFWPAWEWGPKRAPHTRYVCAAYSEQLTLRDNRKCLALVQSDEYQELWGDVFELDKNEQSKHKFANLSTGFKLATAVGGSATGERGDRVIIDDPHNVKDSESEAKRNEALHWFTEVMPSRVNSEASAIVIIMQRVHEEDVSGLIIEQDLGYEHLCIPMEYEVDHPFKSKTCLDFVDPRTEDGELAWPELYPLSRITRDKKVMSAWGGDFAVAGQFQQRPAPRGGGMFKEEDFIIVDFKDVPAGGTEVRGWDLAATKDGRAAWTVGLKMKRVRSGDLYIMDVERLRGRPSEVDAAILKCARADGTKCAQDLPQDPGAAGKVVKSHLANLLSGFVFHITTESGSKEDRARPLASQVEAGKVYLVRAKWNRPFLAEACVFPNGKFKDQVDAASRASARLLVMKKRKVGAAPTLITPTQ